MKLIKTSIEGISYCENKNGITYYGSFRHPITKKSTRKKLINKEKYLKRYDKEAYTLLTEIIEELKNIDNSKEIIEDEEIETKNYMTLNELADLFFKDKRAIKEANLRSQYPQFNNEDFFNYSVIKNKVKNWKKEEYTYNANVRNYAIGDTSANKLTKKVIDNFMIIDINKRAISQKTKFNVINLVSAIINHSIYEERINIINPFPIVQKNKKKRIANPKRKRTRVLSTREITFLLKTLKEKSEDKNSKVQENAFLAVYLAVHTAARANTILNIRVKDIDWKNKTINLYNFKASKQYKMSLNKTAMKFLNDNVKNSFPNSFKHNDYIIRRTDVKRIKKQEPLSRIPEQVYKVMDDLFNRNVDKTDNNDRDNSVNFHTIRRSIATNLAKKGTPIYNIMLLLNHASTKQTLDYLNLHSEEVNEDINNLMDEIFNDFDGSKAKKAHEDKVAKIKEGYGSVSMKEALLQNEEENEKRRLELLNLSDEEKERRKKLSEIPF